MDNYSQFGLGGLAAAMLAAIVLCLRFFVATVNKLNDRNNELTDKFIKISETTIDTHRRLAEAIEANTKGNEINNDKLTTLILSIIKTK